MEWRKTVFRLRALPNTVETLGDAARLVSDRLSDLSVDHISVYSLATSLKPWEDPPSKVATIMFSVPPLLVQRNPDKHEWHIPPKGHDRIGPDLILDTHFIGMTPLNDVSYLRDSYECIAISGLSSHPFGSWQPKGGDKRFMWIRDDLAKHARGARAILYGYDTKMDDSSSFQNVHDLAKQLIDQVNACRAFHSVTPVVFLAHSLGGLVVKQALLALANDDSDEEYKSLLSAVRGAIFFGVPNLGMEQRGFQAIVQDNPNAGLIRDLSQRSNFIRRLTEAFSTSSLGKHCKFFWAYETQESPTVIGPPAILVSPESATCGFVDTNPAATFPINATHSEMVKFSQDSHYYSIIHAKLSHILRSTLRTPGDVDSDAQNENLPVTIPNDINESSIPVDFQDSKSLRTESLLQPLPNSMTAELDKFNQISVLTKAELENFMKTTFGEVERISGDIQMKQELNENLMYMKRLESFLISMKQYGELAEAIQLFTSASNFMAYIWGPMKYILEITREFPEASGSVLSSYQEIGENLPRFGGYHSLFASHPYLRDVLVMIYKDILSFHAEVIRHLKWRQWRDRFSAWWRDLTSTINEITEKTARNKRLIENRVSFIDFETIRKDDLISSREFERDREAQTERCKDTVRHWLSPFDFEAEQLNHRDKRRVCKDPGGWLLSNVEFKTWASTNDSQNPLLWLSGIPGAGKTILASIVVDELSSFQGSTVVYFYCKHGDEQRNSFKSVSRSILAQILKQNPDLLSYFYEKANRNDNAVLTSMLLAKEILHTSLRSCGRVYVVIDGLDECGRAARKEITGWFRHMIDELPAIEMGSIRCLFVSQEDGMAIEDFHGIPSIRITDQNFKDIVDFAGVWHQKIDAKFGTQNRNLNIQSIISGRAKGMFIFAELFAKYLEDQLSIEDLEKQLLPDNLPVDLDHVYERILKRVRESRGADTMRRIDEILGWIVCARRPLRWEEIQSAVCINPEDRCLDDDRKMADSPRDLFASLIECHTDGTVDLVHGTARQYLVKQGSVKPHEAHLSLAMRCLSYLSFPQFDLERRENKIQSDLLSGLHHLYDYASACWAMHLQDGISGVGEDNLNCLQDAVEKFIDLHWSQTHKPLTDIKRVQKTLSSLKNSKKYDQIIQAVAWAKKQSGQHGIGPSRDEALNLWEVTAKIRSVLEKIDSGGEDFRTIKRLYGANRFKCDRVNCYYYHQGFRLGEQRNRHTKKHTRPCLCIVPGCPMEVFGYATQKELENHLFQAHHINEFNDSEELAYPSLPKEKTSRSGKNEANFRCSVCDRTFTQKKSLDRHNRGHSDEKRFTCDSCDKQFKRKEDCDRHKLTHSGKKYTCAGLLKDGTKWGCNESFSRLDKLRNHFRTKKGLKCILPLVEEKQEAGNGDRNELDDNVFADQTGDNAEVLLTAGKNLPPFREFLLLCGLGKLESDVGAHFRARPSPKVQSNRKI